MSPFLPGGVSDGNWHTVHIHYYNKVSLHLNLLVCSRPFWSLIFTSELRSCLTDDDELSPEVFSVVIVCISLIWTPDASAEMFLSLHASKALWIDLRCLCVHTIMWVFTCHHFIHAYSPHISFNFLHILSFSSASYTLCEYECVSECTYCTLPSLFLFLHLLLSSFSIQQTVREEWVCCLSVPSTIFLPMCLLLLVLLTKIFPSSF